MAVYVDDASIPATIPASRLLNVARQADPSKAAQWAERADRVHTAAREKAAKVAGPDDPRPLAEVVSARLEATGLTADSPELRLIAGRNADRRAAAGEAEPGPEPDDQAAPGAQPDLLTDTEREAAR